MGFAFFSIVVDRLLQCKSKDFSLCLDKSFYNVAIRHYRPFFFVVSALGCRRTVPTINFTLNEPGELLGVEAAVRQKARDVLLLAKVVVGVATQVKQEICDVAFRQGVDVPCVVGHLVTGWVRARSSGD